MRTTMNVTMIDSDRTVNDRCSFSYGSIDSDSTVNNRCSFSYGSIGHSPFNQESGSYHNNLMIFKASTANWSLNGYNSLMDHDTDVRPE